MIKSNWTSFSYHVNKIIQEAFCGHGADPEQIAKFILDKVKHRPCRKDEKEKLLAFLKFRKITHAIHFTRIENVSSILRYGIIPRVHLECEAVKIMIHPFFSDDSRFDGHSEMNCLSISFPNYKMLYSKCNQLGGKWCVVLIDPSFITDYYCEFYASNAASNTTPNSGMNGISSMFYGESIRNELGLKKHETTNPQAEVMEDTIIHPSKVSALIVKTSKDKDFLISKDVQNNMVSVNPEWFKPRRDWKYWQNNSH